MRQKVENGLGVITVSNNVIASISNHALKSCYGVVGISTSKVKDSFVAFVTGGAQKKGINIISDGEGLTIDLYLVVKYGVSIKAVSEIVTQNVKYQIEKQTGFNVKQVLVTVSSVKLDEGGKEIDPDIG